MTDLEITKLCAEAIGWYETQQFCENQLSLPPWSRLTDEKNLRLPPWNRLDDDAQAMALVKRFQLCFFAMDEKFTFGAGEPWQCRGPNGSFACNAELNRAIVMCVAKMQAALNGTTATLSEVK